MMYVPYTPERAPLAGHVELMFLLDGYSPEHAVERLVPNGRIALVIELDHRVRHVLDNDTLEPRQACRHAWMSGMHTGYITIETAPDTVLLAVQLAPGKAYPLLQRPIHELNDRVVPASDVLGPAVLALRDELLAAAAPEQALRIAERWLSERFDADALPHPDIDAAVARIVANPRVGTLKDLLNRTRFSHKHFLHLFKKYVGLSPKHLQRVLRFAEVLPLIHEQKTVNWAQLSAECGYFDQSHFIKDFRKFSGYRPQAFFAEQHDRLNFFPDDPD